MKHGFRIIFSILLLLSAQVALAHKVNMFAFVEGNEVFVEGYFLDGKKPKNCEVTVFDDSNKVLLTGLTNDEGQFTFAVPTTQAIRIKLDAGEGHMTEYLLSADEIAMVDAASDSSESTQDTVRATAVAPVIEGSSAVVSGQSQADLLVIQKAIGRSLHPVMRALDELKERRTMSDIIGGIGIIIGIGGLFLYFKARKMTSEKS